MRRNQSSGLAPPGFTVVELLLAIGVIAAVLAMSVPISSTAMDDVRTAMAARYVEGRIMDARMRAVTRSAYVGLRFEASSGDYRVAEFLDGNGNGIRTAEIHAGVDRQRGSAALLRESFSGVSFGLRPEIPDIDGVVMAGDGVRIGTSRLLTLGPDGTATSGTLYVRGRRSQYAVRVLGATGRTRVIRFDVGTRRWISR
jgi:type II secretory pathway pseudopilin PulG